MSGIPFVRTVFPPCSIVCRLVRVLPKLRVRSLCTTTTSYTARAVLLTPLPALVPILSSVPHISHSSLEVEGGPFEISLAALRNTIQAWSLANILRNTMAQQSSLVILQCTH